MTSRFEGILSCLESGMKPFGDNFARVVFWNLEQTRGISREDAIDRPQEFIKCLREIFGSGSSIIERCILKELKNRFNLAEEDIVECANAIQSAKRHVILVTA